MNTEIERRFLVPDGSKVPSGVEHVIKQGYMYSGDNGTVRFRVLDDKGYVTIKGRPQQGHFARSEYEYQIPQADAESMIENLCGTRVIHKTRRVVSVEGYNWEVDFFHGYHQGLIIAELELDREDCQFSMPDFVGEEITAKKGYSNAALSLKTVCK